MKALTIRLEDNVHRSLRIFLAQKNTSAQVFFSAGIKKTLDLCSHGNYEKCPTCGFAGGSTWNQS